MCLEVTHGSGEAAQGTLVWQIVLYEIREYNAHLTEKVSSPAMMALNEVDELTTDHSLLISILNRANCTFNAFTLLTLGML